MLCVLFFCVLLWEKEHFWDSLWRFFSHRSHRFNGPFCALFRFHRRPPAYRIHRAFQLKVAVRFCEIGWLNVSVKPCVFCSSVIFCERKIVGYSQLGFFSLTLRRFFSHRAHRVHWVFWRTFRAHRRPPAYRVHRGLSTNISCNALWYRLT